MYRSILNKSSNAIRAVPTACVVNFTHINYLQTMSTSVIHQKMAVNPVKTVTSTMVHTIPVVSMHHESSNATTKEITDNGGSEDYPLVSPKWLNENLDSIKVIDCSWRMGHKGACATEYLDKHIPGAIYVDVDAVADMSNPKPHAIPSEEKFSSVMSSFGISHTDAIVVYDTSGLLAAPRFWWTLKLFGAENVRILDGGLRAWAAEGFTTCSGDETAEAMAAASTNADKGNTVEFKAKINAKMLTNMSEVVQAVGDGADKDVLLIDARSPGRFAGTELEPRAGLKGGHMPGARNLPYGALVSPDGRLKSQTDLADVISEQGINLSDLTSEKSKKKIIATCGSGMTAATVYLALHTLGCRGLSLYDGSWTEYGNPDLENPVKTGKD